MAIYSLIALMLILSACGIREPKETSGIEPKAILSVAPNRELSTINLVYPNYSYGFEGEAKKKEVFYKLLTSTVEAREKKSEVKKARIEPLISTKSLPAPQQKAKEEAKTKKVSSKSVKTVKNTNGKKRTFTLTAYTAGFESTGKRKGDKDYGKTSSGAMVKQGRTIACPKSYPTGTKVYIPSLDNTYTCEDTGGDIKEGRIDVYFDDVGVARKFGRKIGVVGYVLKDSN